MKPFGNPHQSLFNLIRKERGIKGSSVFLGWGGMGKRGWEQFLQGLILLAWVFLPPQRYHDFPCPEFGFSLFAPTFLVIFFLITIHSSPPKTKWLVPDLSCPGRIKNTI